MRIIYIGYWGANEGLSQATIMPHLKILAEIDEVECIDYFSIEREKINVPFLIPNLSKIHHHPHYSLDTLRVLSKLIDVIKISQKVIQLINKKQNNLIICRSTLAGSIGHITHLITKAPYLVESFEPHADYMEELGVWNKHFPSFKLQKWFEKKQKQYAIHLIPVSYNYQSKLINEGINPERISVAPCAVDLEKFAFSAELRKEMRSSLNISDETVVGIYVGKFGDIYWDEKAFEIFKSAAAHISKFFLIILSPQSKDFIEKRLREFKIDRDQVYYDSVNHNEVNKYLSASDFAFSTIKPSLMRKYCSPIKHGEYWANGLPIILPSGIGDDSDIIEKKKIGVILQKEIEWGALISIVRKNRQNSIIQETARELRSFNNIKKTYEHVISKLSLK